MKRVLQVVSCLESGGTEAFIMNNYRAVDKKKIQFDFLVFVKNDHPYIEEIKKMGGKVFFAMTPSIKRIKSFLAIVEKIIKENGPYSAVHSHVNIANSWVMLAAKNAGVPIRISHSHAVFKDGNTFENFLRKYQINLIKKNATDFLACSNEAGNSLYGEKFFSNNGKVIKNGIDLHKFFNITEKAEKLKNEFNLSNENDLILGNITRFDSNKNQTFIVDIFYEILKKKNNAILILGGVDGGALVQVKEKVSVLGIENNVRFIGKRQDVPECLKFIDAYVFPTIYEGLGIAILEAQASGCECFVSTGVSQEADMGIGIMNYYDLNDGAEVWAKRIIKKCENRNKPSKERIQEAFDNKGFDISSSVEELVLIYEK